MQGLVHFSNGSREVCPKIGEKLCLKQSHALLLGNQAFVVAGPHSHLCSNTTAHNLYSAEFPEALNTVSIPTLDESECCLAYTEVQVSDVGTTA